MPSAEQRWLILAATPHLKCCRRVCAQWREEKHGKAKHMQHLLRLCLAPVNAVSLSLGNKATTNRVSPIQASLLPPLSSFMAQAPGQLPGSKSPQLSEAQSNTIEMIAGPAVRNRCSTQNNYGPRRGENEPEQSPSLLSLCLDFVVSLLPPFSNRQVSPGQNDSSLRVFNK